MGDKAIETIINEVFPGIKKTQDLNNSSEVTQSNPEYVAQYVAFLQHILNRAKQENNYDLLDELVRLLGPSEDVTDTGPQQNNILDAITQLLQTRELEDVTAPPIDNGLLSKTAELLDTRSVVEPSAPLANKDLLSAIDELLQTSTAQAAEAAAKATAQEAAAPAPAAPASAASAAPVSTSCNDANICIEQIDNDNNNTVTNTISYNITGQGKQASIVQTSIVQTPE